MAATYDTRLERMPHECFRHVCSFLGFTDLHTLYRALVVVRPVDPGESCYQNDGGDYRLKINTITLLGGVPLCTDYDCLDPGVRELCAEESVRIQRHVVFGDTTDLLPLGLGYSGSECGPADDEARPRNRDDIGAWIRRVSVRTHRNMTGSIRDACYYTRILRCTERCMRCQERFGIHVYWAYTADPKYLCPSCQHVFSFTAKMDKKHLVLNSQWFWISASHLKEMCDVPSAVRAEDFARKHGIRAQSNTAHDNEAVDALRGHGTKPRKDFYFYGDVRRYLSGQ